MFRKLCKPNVSYISRYTCMDRPISRTTSVLQFIYYINATFIIQTNNIIICIGIITIYITTTCYLCIWTLFIYQCVTAVNCYSAVIRVESEINTRPLSYNFKSDTNRLHLLPYTKGFR